LLNKNLSKSDKINTTKETIIVMLIIFSTFLFSFFIIFLTVSLGLITRDITI